MRYLLSLLSTGWILLAGPSWASSLFDEVARTPHNLLASKAMVGFKKVCLSCHTDGQVLREGEAGSQPEAPNPSAEAGPPMDVSHTPLWSPGQKGETYSLVGSQWRVQSTLDRKPFGSSSACLGCHDGALAQDVHGEEKDPKTTKTLRERPLDHPTSIPYPRRPNGVFTTDRPTPGSLRYWSIADRTAEGVAMPTGPVSSYFRLPEGVDPKDPMVAATVVRTSYGIIHCDSCHNPHLNQYPPFLRTPPKDLCFICHDR